MESIKFNIMIERARLRAALIFAAHKDIRYYLNGVLLEIDEARSARLVSTDGHRLAVVVLADQADAMPGQYLIPRDVIKPIKRASRTTGAWVSLSIDGDRVSVTNGDEIISGGRLIDGKFPDWQRVLPRPETMSGEAGTFNGHYLGDIATAAIELGEKFPSCPLIHNGPNNAGLAVFEHLGLAVVVMPMRTPDRPENMDQFYPRRVPVAIVETAKGGQAFPCDPVQDVSDKRAPGVVAHCGPELAAAFDPSGALQAAGLLVVAHVGDDAPSAWAESNGATLGGYPRAEVFTRPEELRPAQHIGALARPHFSVPTCWKPSGNESNAPGASDIDDEYAEYLASIQAAA